ncbi:hypothetical protein D021_1393A, partial [Vibrio parahaemolyticus 10296]|jgi:hypothetical protein
MIST